MAYGVKYTASETSADGSVYTVEILKNGYGGASSAIKLAKPCAVVRWGQQGDDVHEPVKPSSAEILVFDKAKVLQAEVFNADEEMFRLQVKKAGNVYWLGKIVTDGFEDSLDLAPEATKIMAIDGLGQLEGIGFEETTRVSIVQTTSDILKELGLDLNIRFASNWFTPDILSSEDPLAVVYTGRLAQRGDNDDVLSTLDVLREYLAGHGLQLHQSDGFWWVIQRELLKDTSFTYFEYDKDGAFVESDIFNPSVSVTDTTQYSNRLKGGRRLYKKAFKTATSRYVPKPSTGTIIENGSFEDWAGDVPDGWTESDDLGVVSKSLEHVDGYQSLSMIASYNADPDALPLGRYLSRSLDLVGDGVGSLKIRVSAQAVKNPSRPSGPTSFSPRKAYFSVLFNGYYLHRASDGTMSWVAYTGVQPDASLMLIHNAGCSAIYLGWQEDVIITPPVPAGSGQLEIQLYPLAEFEYTPGSESTTAGFTAILYDNVVIMPVNAGLGQEAIAAASVAPNTVNRDPIQFRIGDGPTTLTPSALTVGLTTTLTSDWKRGPYTVEDPTGKSIDVLRAETWLRAQKQPLEIHTATYTARADGVGVILEAHHVLVIGTKRFAFTYLERDLIAAHSNGEWVELRADDSDITTSVTPVTENTGGSSSGGSVLVQFSSESSSILAGRNKFTSLGYDGTIDDAGTITVQGTQGWAITGDDDFEFIKGANDYIRGSGSTLELHTTQEIVVQGGIGDDRFTIVNPTPSTYSVQQHSPWLTLTAHAWDTTTGGGRDTAVSWRIRNEGYRSPGYGGGCLVFKVESQYIRRPHVIDEQGRELIGYGSGPFYDRDTGPYYGFDGEDFGQWPIILAGNISGLNKVVVGWPELSIITDLYVTGETYHTGGTDYIALNDLGATKTFAKIGMVVVSDVATAEAGSMTFSTMKAGTLTEQVRLDNDGKFTPAANDSATLGSTSLQWSDLFLASGGVVNFANGNATITHSTGLLTFSSPIAGSSATFARTTEQLRLAYDVSNYKTFTVANNGLLTIEGAGTNKGVVLIRAASANAGISFERTTDVASTAQFYLDANGELSFGTVSNKAFQILTNNLSRAKMTAVGNFGVGTYYSAEATARLEVESTAGPQLRVQYSTTYFLGLSVDAAGAASITTTANTISTTSLLSITKTTEQLRASYNATNFLSTTVAGTGATAFAITSDNGTPQFSFNKSITPAANDGAALGTTALQWSDLFLASGSVINFANGDSTITHSPGLLTFSIPIRLAYDVSNYFSITQAGSGGATTLASTGNSIYTLSSITSANAVSFVAGSASTTGAISLWSGGTYTGSLKAAALTLGGREWTLPNASGTIITTGNLSSITATGALASGSIAAGFTAIADTYLSTISTAGKVSGTAITDGNMLTSGSITSTNANAFVAGSTTVDGLIQLWSAANDCLGGLVAATLTLGRTWTFPNASGTIITTGNLSSITATGALASGSIAAGFTAIADTYLSTISTAGKVSGTAITDGNMLTSGSITSTNANAFVAGSTTVDGLIQLWSAANDCLGGLVAATLTLGRTWTFPNASGTIITTGNLSSITATGALASGSIAAGFTAIADTYLSTISTAGKVSGTAITDGNMLTSGSITSTNANAFVAGSTTVDGLIQLWSAANDCLGGLVAATLTLGRTWTFPNASGTIITTGNLSSITATGALASGSIAAGFTAIADTYLSTISTAGKVSGTAITDGNMLTSGSITSTNANAFVAGSTTVDGLIQLWSAANDCLGNLQVATLTLGRIWTFPNLSGTILVGADNLGSLTNAGTARTNLGLGTMALEAIGIDGTINFASPPTSMTFTHGKLTAITP